MSPEARKLAQALLDHHRKVCRLQSKASPSIDSCLIAYGDLCEQAGLSHKNRTWVNFCAKSRSGATTTAGRRSMPWPSIMRPAGPAMAMTALPVAASSAGRMTRRHVLSLPTIRIELGRLHYLYRLLGAKLAQPGQRGPTRECED